MPSSMTRESVMSGMQFTPGISMRRPQYPTTLAREGFEVFLPLHTPVRQWSDRVKEVSLPLFSSSVFLREGLGRRLRIPATTGVHG